MFDININKIVALSLIIIIFVIINSFDTVFSYINIIRKNFVKEEDEQIRSKVNNFLSNILWYKITINILFIICFGLFYRLVFRNIVLDIKYSMILSLMSILLLIIIQIITKVIAKINIYSTLISTIDYIDMLSIIIYPLVKIYNNIYLQFNNKLNDGKYLEDEDVTEEDIKRMINSASSDVEEEEIEMIHSIFNFTDTTVREIMTPRTSVVAFNKNDVLGEVWDEIIECEFSRVPIYDESIDNIIGVLYTKDLLKHTSEEDRKLKLETFIKELAFIPETKTLTSMLEYFKKIQQHMAVIIDEYGGTLGIITIEDLLEEIVGEIRDEYDVEEEKVKKLSENIYEILGETLVEEINSELGLDIELNEEYDTISGYIQYKLERVASIKDKVVEDKYIIQVSKIDNKKIEKVKLIIK